MVISAPVSVKTLFIGFNRNMKRSPLGEGCSHVMP